MQLEAADAAQGSRCAVHSSRLQDIQPDEANVIVRPQTTQLKEICSCKQAQPMQQIQ
jgi:hypothetical protein